MESGDSCNVSWVRGSAHVGTHVDFPYHFEETDSEIPPLSAFIGPAFVVEVENWDDLRNRSLPAGLRFLFKTRNSATPFTVFDEGFECIPSWMPAWLAERGAMLIGVDGPSVDPADSKELPNHRALRAAGIAILENLDLSLAEEGPAELIALPLKVEGADASWVRAILRYDR
jgi:arylformamidase